MTIDARLLAAAKAARENAYARYSGYAVGAAILADNGKVYAGANVENASYPEGQCAETSALGAMVTDGARAIAAILVLGPEGCTPCGGCRQRIKEFASAETMVLIADESGVKQRFSAYALLPVSFGLEPR